MSRQPTPELPDRPESDAGKASLLLFRPYRLPSPRYREVLAKGRSWPGRMVVLWVLPSEMSYPRMGVIVSKRTQRESVDRARARRLLREAFRLQRPRIAAGYDVILMGRFRIAGAVCGDVMKDVERLCKKAGIWQAEPPREPKSGGAA